MTLTPLSRDKHADLRVLPLSSYGFAANNLAISLYCSEALRAAHEFPIAFTAEKEGYFPAALLGLTVGENLFIDGQGRWLGAYLPAILRRGAFRLAQVKDSDRWLLCIDEESAQFSRSEGQALFDAAGASTPLVEQVTQFLLSLERDRTNSLAACAELDRQGLIMPWDLMVTRPDGSEQRVDGLFKIDETKFVDCAPDALWTLNRCGALALIYAHFMSLHKMLSLRELALKRLSLQKRAPAPIQDLDHVFGIVEDDPFIF